MSHTIQHRKQGILKAMGTPSPIPHPQNYIGGGVMCPSPPPTLRSWPPLRPCVNVLLMYKNNRICIPEQCTDVINDISRQIQVIFHHPKPICQIVRRVESVSL